MKIPVPALFQKTCFRRTAVTVATIGAVAILYALTYHKPRNEWDDWFVSIEKNPQLATNTSHPKWADVTAPTLSPAWKPSPPNPKDWSPLQKEKDILRLQYKGKSDLTVKPHQSPVVHADANGTATLSDGTVVTLKDATLIRYGKQHTFAAKDGKIARLSEKKISEDDDDRPEFRIHLNTSKSLNFLSSPIIYDSAGGIIEGFFQSKIKNEFTLISMLWVYYDTPLKFCALINHGEPQHLTVPATPETTSTGKWGSFCYLGEVRDIKKGEIKTRDNGTIYVIHAFGHERRFCVFTTDSVLGNEMKVILEDGREFMTERQMAYDSVMIYTLPEDADDIPIKSFVFTQYSELSRVVFDIPSLIDFFPENKGVKNRFDVKITRWNDDGLSLETTRKLFGLGLGMDTSYLNRRTSVKKWRTKTKFLPPNYTARINPAGKTYRDILVEYLQVVDNSKPEDVVLDKTRGLLYVKMPLHARLLLWWEKPTLKRWPWSDPGP